MSAPNSYGDALQAVQETRRMLKGREDESFHISSAAALHLVYQCLDKVEAALAGSPPENYRAVVEKHRRHVELSPGVGEDVQKYALAVCDDILADLPPATGEKA